MTPLDRIEAAEKAATLGPWWHDGQWKVHAPCPGRISPWTVADLQNAYSDGPLIALLRNHAASLIAVARAAQTPEHIPTMAAGMVALAALLTEDSE